MAHSLHSSRSRVMLLVAFTCGVLCVASRTMGAIPLDPPESFFTNIADRLLQQQLGVRLTEIQIAPTNQYSAAVHRIFQVTANLYDAMSNDTNGPSVFRPIFGPGPVAGANYIIGFTNDNFFGPDFENWLAGNTNGIPLVIAARKGYPNFNELTIRTDVLLTRKMQVTRAGVTPWSQLTGTNLMYMLGVSNSVYVEAWNSYSRRFNTPVTLEVSNLTVVALTNEYGYQNMLVFSTNVATNITSWPRFDETQPFAPGPFILAMNATNKTIMSNAVYRFDINTFTNINTNVYELTPTFPLLYSVLNASNRIAYRMHPQSSQRILDFLLLSSQHSVDVYREIEASPNPYSSVPGVRAYLIELWSTNRSRGVTGPTDGVLRQLDVALGNISSSLTEWRAFSPNQLASENEKDAAIDAFRNFMGFSRLTTNAFVTNLTFAMQAPFNPSAKMIVETSWQANDPLVHCHASDLLFNPTNQNRQYLKPSSPATNIWPATIAGVNDRYSPWAGNPTKSTYPENSERAMQDAGVYSSDLWRFPTNERPAAGWLGRVHRGTPWQTIYLKSDVSDAAKWVADNHDLCTHPTNDWRMATLLASLFNTNDVRTLTSINTTNFASWAATLTGLTVLSNNRANPFLGEPPTFDINIITADAPQISAIVAGINRTRSAQRGQYFADVAAFLSVPELSSASPWLNLSTSDQLLFGLTDEAYEMLPSQLLSLIRADPVGSVRRSGGSLEITFTAFDGYAYRVEASANLATWSTLSEPHYATNGVFTLSTPLNSGLQFFRAVLP